MTRNYHPTHYDVILCTATRDRGGYKTACQHVADNGCEMDGKPMCMDHYVAASVAAAKREMVRG